MATETETRTAFACDSALLADCILGNEGGNSLGEEIGMWEPPEDAAYRRGGRDWKPDGNRGGNRTGGDPFVKEGRGSGVEPFDAGDGHLQFAAPGCNSFEFHSQETNEGEYEKGEKYGANESGEADEAWNPVPQSNCADDSYDCSLTESALTPGKSRMYRCRRCGVPKKGHVCNARSRDSRTRASQSAVLPRVSSPEPPSKMIIPNESYHGVSAKKEHAHTGVPCTPNSNSFSVSRVEMSEDDISALIPSAFIGFTELPYNSKVLLTSGALEGQTVKYIEKSGKIRCTGIVHKANILCLCNRCRGRTLVNLSEFEKHAGSIARYPSTFTKIRNGRSLKDIVTELSQAKSLEETPLILARCLRYDEEKEDETTMCWNCGEYGIVFMCNGCDSIYHPSCVGLEEIPVTQWFCDSCSKQRNICNPSQTSLPEGVNTDTNYVHMNSNISHDHNSVSSNVENYNHTLNTWNDTISRKHRRVETLNLTRSVEKSKAHKRDPALHHKALFLPGGLPDGIELTYYSRGQAMLGGKKQGGGILCDCCGSVISCSQFEHHAGMGARRNPYNCICLSDGRSLHEVALDMMTENRKINQFSQNHSDLNDDNCYGCGDGGILVLCDKCPAAYHPECVGLAGIPSGDWYCPACTNKESRRKRSSLNERESNIYSYTPNKSNMGCKKQNDLDGNAERTSVVSLCKRLLNDLENVGGGCVLCRSGSHDFSKNGFGPRTIILCDQCEREFHVGCLKAHGLADLACLPENEWFCCEECEQIHSDLHGFLSLGNGPIPESVRKDPRFAYVNESGDYTWQILKGRRGDPANGRTLMDVINLYTESFNPIVDKSTGTDLIPIIVHSQNTKDHDFGGMYCVVLKYKGKLVCSASIRVFGRTIAEMPLVATSNEFRRKGYCRLLFQTIEYLLTCLGVKSICLPSAAETKETWINGFQFSRMKSQEFHQLRTEFSILVFPGTAPLHRPVPPSTAIKSSSKQNDNTTTINNNAPFESQEKCPSTPHFLSQSQSKAESEILAQSEPTQVVENEKNQFDSISDKDFSPNSSRLNLPTMLTYSRKNKALPKKELPESHLNKQTNVGVNGKLEDEFLSNDHGKADADLEAEKCESKFRASDLREINGKEENIEEDTSDQKANHDIGDEFMINCYDTSNSILFTTGAHVWYQNDEEMKEIFTRGEGNADMETEMQVETGEGMSSPDMGGTLENSNIHQDSDSNHSMELDEQMTNSIKKRKRMMNDHSAIRDDNEFVVPNGFSMTDVKCNASNQEVDAPPLAFKRSKLL